MSSKPPMGTRVLWSWLRLCCLAHLLIFFSNGFYGGISATSAEENTDDIGEMGQGQEDAITQSKVQIPQNVADNNFNELPWLPKHSKEMNFIKRAPMGFAGVRGKKIMNTWPPNAQNNAIDERWKKTQAAFYGVRGKKYGDYDTDILPWESKNQLQKQHGKQDERDALIQDLIDRWAEASLLEENIVGKRAPVGFTGMRGKRYFEKNSLNNAFMGVRGKKDNEHHQFYKRSLTYDQPEIIGRRFADFANKFVAVRGKKDRNLSNSRERYFVNMWPALSLASSGKRVPVGFVGMRGK